MNCYKILNNQIFTNEDYSFVPIRNQDRYLIMKWRNEQIYHLRQKTVLTEKDQDNYFVNIINPLFDQDEPEQLLFSYLKNGRCIGYGGLVHINWIDSNAELSFLIDTELEKNEFDRHYSNYLKFINHLKFLKYNLITLKNIFVVILKNLKLLILAKFSIHIFFKIFLLLNI